MRALLAALLMAIALAGCTANDADPQSIDGSTTPRSYMPDDGFGDTCPTSHDGTSSAGPGTTTGTGTGTSSPTGTGSPTSQTGTPTCHPGSQNATSSYPGP